MEYEELYNKALQIKGKYDIIAQQQKDREIKKEELIELMKSKLHQQVIYEEAVNYMKNIIDKLSRSHIEHLEKLLNNAISTIFFDKNYKIEFEISEFRNSNCLNIYLIETMNDGSEIKTDIKDNGFGVKTIVGFILQIYFIMYHNLAHVLFLDEALSALSSQYIPYLKSLLDSLKKEYNFIFVLVAHDIRFIDIADRKYEVKNGEVRLCQE